MQPQRPQQVSEFAEACLQALARCGAGSRISLGRAFGLDHDHEHRTTADVDAWWQQECSAREQQAVVDAIEQVLSPRGEVLRRRHGDVVSLDLARAGKTVFGFQIARRSVLLAPTVESPWPPIRLDSLEDLVAAKMAALTERGAPRDFLVRLCGAWDFGIMPWPRTLEQVLGPGWRAAVEEAQMLTSCAYHLLRDLHQPPPARCLGPRFPEIERDPCLHAMWQARRPPGGGTRRQPFRPVSVMPWMK